MIISHKKKFACICIPKTGTETINSALNLFSDVERNNSAQSETYIHSTANNTRAFFKKNKWDWNDYFKFTFTRNLFEMEVSQYFYIQRRVDEFNTLTEEQQNSLPATDQNSIFFYKKWYKKTFKQWAARDKHAFNLSLSNYICDKEGNNLLNFLGKFENLQEDFNAICDKIGIPRQELPHKNKSNHKHYTEYYDDETRQLVAKKYAKDIEQFGYKFGG
jgi:chondroitin 4-sulfotransferase 11